MWNGFECEKFLFCERTATIVKPAENANGRILLKTEYLDAFPGFDVEMLKRGYYLIHISHRTRWAPDEETDIMADFVRHCAKELNADKRCVLEGMSCGGLQAAKFAEKYPELVSVMYLDAPVLNILSQLGFGEHKSDVVERTWRELVATYGFNKSTVVNFRKSPIDNMKPLIDNNIPVIMLYGNADSIVVYEENGKVLEDYYKENGGNIKVIAKSMCGHHPHGLDDPSLIIDFVERNFN
jgi:pimeloyl-ACP methyl ester carboxylesterase